MDDSSKPLRARPELRLVTDRDRSLLDEIKGPENEPGDPLKSVLARRLTNFADDLDRQIARLLSQ